MATGDTQSACKKIANIIDPNGFVMTYDSPEALSNLRKSIIFTGFVPEKHGEALLNFLNCPPEKRPLFYFCSMSMEEKGKLAAFLSKHQFYVIANGDAVNDTHLVANSDFSFVHGPADSNKTAIKGDMTAFDAMSLIQKSNTEIKGDALSIYQTHFLSKKSPLMQLAATVFFGTEQTLPSMTIFKGMKCGSQILLRGPDQFLPGPRQANTALVNLLYDTICYAKILGTGMSRTSPTFMEALPDRRDILQKAQILSIAASSVLAIAVWMMDYDEYTFGASMFMAVGLSLASISVMLGRFGEAPDDIDEYEDENAIGSPRSSPSKSPNKRSPKKNLN
jgi:hypothetical protein